MDWTASEFAILARDDSPRPSQRILVVEDNLGDAELALETLRDELPADYEVELATTLQAALAALGSGSTDAVILDLNLPDSRGLETLNQVRRAAEQAPVIVVSGLVDEIMRVGAMQAGAQEVLPKGDWRQLRTLSRTVRFMLDRARLRAQRRQLQSLLDASPDAILVVNAHGVVRYVNQTATRLFERNTTDLLGEVLGFSVRDGELSEIEVPNGKEMRQCEMRVVPIEWNLESCSLATIRDITERLRFEEMRRHSAELEAQNQRIAEASRMKSQFLANMSHELRTPLNAIIGFADLLKEHMIAPDSPKFEQYLGHIGSSGRHLLQLINDILDLAKVEAGKFVFHPENVKVPSLVREVVGIVSSLAEQRRIRLSVQCDPQVQEVFIDPGRLKQVLYNYVSNALKFTPDGGQVQVRTVGINADWFRLEVEDNGVGIAKADLDRLFVEFQQLDSGSTRRHKGTGLGLALTRRLVTAQGGTVGVDSAPGWGSVFHAVLPRRARTDIEA